MNVFGMGPMEVLLIVILALIVFGPAKLPEIMGQVGKAIGDFRRATSELSEEFNRTIQTELGETRQIVEETRAALTDVRTAVTEVQHDVNTAVATATTVPRIAPTLDGPSRTGVNGTGAGEALNGTAPGAVPGEALAAPGTETETLSTPPVSPQPELPPLQAADQADVPPLADTNQWSWETSVESRAAAPGGTAESEPGLAAANPELAAHAAEDPPSVTPPAENVTHDQKRVTADETRPGRGEQGAAVARDDLAPPY
jgi:TatA/E family protein of Tat protein translocase